MVRNVFKIRSLSRRRACYCNANRRMLEKRWSTVKSYLCGDEWNSIVAEKDSDSPSISVSVSISGIQNHYHNHQEEEEEEFISSDSIWGSNKNRTGILSDDDFELCSNYDGEDDDDDDDDGDYSIKSSEATITQPMNIVLLVCGEGSDKKRGRRRTDKSNSTRKLFQQEDAAIIIQSEFRKYLARRQFRNGDENVMQERVLPIPSPSESLKVQTGDSTDTTTTTISSSFHIKEKHKIICKSTQKRVKPQEEWDDSTVSSSISRKRLQNKIDAATRRERALAYAFAQQLRICSKKRTKCSSSSNRLEENENKSRSLNWLERWMATRDIESRYMMDDDDDDETHNIMMHNSMSIHEGNNKDILSGGSNQLSLQIHGFSLKAPRRLPPPPPAKKNKPKTPPTLTNISTRKTLHPHPPKVGKKSCNAEQEKHNKYNLKQSDSKKSVKFQDSSSIIT